MVLLGAFYAPLARWIETFDQSVDQPRLLQFRAGGFLVVPVLVVVELGPVLSEARLVYDFIAAELAPERRRLVVIVETTVREMDITITSSSIGLPPRYMLCTVKHKFTKLIRVQSTRKNFGRKNVTYAWITLGDVFLQEVPVLNLGGLSSVKFI